MATAKKKNNNRRKAGIKALRQTIRKTAKNDAKRAAINTHERFLKKALAAKDMEAVKKEATTLQSLYAKAAKVGVLHKNTAGRKTSKVSKHIA